MIVIIDNYDSFTYNLVQYFNQMDTDVVVYRNDAVNLYQIRSLHPDLIVLSPGPGVPAASGVCKEVLHACCHDTPILGVCLGHQLIVEYFGGIVEKGARPMHGKVTGLTHDGQTVFRHVPEKINVTRYHSLQALLSDMPPELEVSAMSEDRVVMAVRHKSLPVEGIQFHPESILTDYGFEMLSNIYKQALHFRERSREGVGV